MPHRKPSRDVSYQTLIDGNRRFVKETLATDPEYFKRLAQGQRPHTLWIGCADSRVPANQITGTNPGDIFVHRNIANVVLHTDSNMLSVLQYAVEVLKVPQVIVCGHYGCGGVISALTNQSLGFIDIWLRNIKDVYHINRAELEAMSPEERQRRMVELNVAQSVRNLCRTAIIQRAWSKGDAPQVHGWVYDLSDGLIKDLELDCTPDKLDALDRYDFEG